MNLSDALTREIIQRLLLASRPERIILFGSAATGEMGPDSDIDLLALFREPLDHWEESIRLRQVLRGLGYPFDVLVMSVEKFERTKNLIGGIAYPAHKYGRVIYESS